MSDAQTARARSGLYDLLARLVLDGPIGDVLDWAASIPPLAEAMPDEDAEEAAARHHDVLGMELLPWASAMLGPDGQMGGHIAGEADEWVGATGLQVPRGVEPDHVGVLLRALALTSATEAEGGLGMPRPGIDLLLWSLPPLVAAAKLHADPLYSVVFELCLELTSSHRAELGPPEAWDLPGEGLLLDEPTTGLGEVAAFLAVPSRSGLLVTRSAIDRWARAGDVPRGFGARADMLQTLLLGASDQHALSQVLNAMSADLARTAALYGVWAEIGVPTGPWRGRIMATEALLVRMETALPY